MSDPIPSLVPSRIELLWRILVTVLLLLILAGPGAKALIAMVMPIASSVAPLVLLNPVKSYRLHLNKSLEKSYRPC
jgi:hypothetical protein